MKLNLPLDERALAQRSTKHFSILVAVSSLANGLRWTTTPIPLVNDWLITTAIACFLILLSVRKNLSVFWSSVLFWISFLAVAYCIAHTNTLLASLNLPYAAFAGFKVTALAIAVFAPQPLLNGYLSIAVCGLLPLLMYFTSLSTYHATMSMQEPGLTFVTCLVAFIVLLYRNRSLKLERSYARLQIEKENLNEMAHIFLAMRDLTNTPLQAIELTASLLKSNHLTTEEAAKYLNQSVDRLSKLSQLLSHYEQDRSFLSDSKSLYTSFDPVAYLQERLSLLQEKGRHLETSSELSPKLRFKLSKKDPETYH